MNKLRLPLKHCLDEPMPELRVLAVWRRVDTPHARPRGARRAQLLAATLGMLLGFAGFSSWIARAGAPLALHDASVLAPRSVLGGERPSSWRLTDGSQIALGAASRLEILENSDAVFALQLSSGRGGFDVQRREARRWSIACAELEVEVVEGRVDIEHDASVVNVRVQRGEARVSGPHVPLRVQRVVAGETFAAAKAHAPPPAAELPEAGSRGAGPGAAGVVEPQAGSRGAAGDTEPTPVAAEAPRRPLDRASAAELATLLHQADRARELDPARARTLLERVRASAPGSAHAALASWSLARMRMPHAPSLAAADIALALQADLPEALREDAHAKLVEAHARAGDGPRARAAAEIYRHAYPHGSYAAETERWAIGP